MVCDHMVWKATTSVGCGFATVEKGDGMKDVFMVCQYHPRGNTGAYSHNVMEPTGNSELSHCAYGQWTFQVFSELSYFR